MNPLIVANWKMNPSDSLQAEKIAEAVEISVREYETVICPPFTFIEKAGSIFNKASLGAQNCSWEVEGAMTGEISPRMLKNIGVRYVIIGHSERRKIFGESNDMISKKVKTALTEGLSVILCVGETEEEMEDGRTEEVIGIQLEEGIGNSKGDVIIAYEPVWAIGSGKACNPDAAEKARLFIKGKMENLSFQNSRILYGGSVNSKNAADYLNKALFSGLLVGGASLDIEEFKKIIGLSR